MGEVMHHRFVNDGLKLGRSLRISHDGSAYNLWVEDEYGNTHHSPPYDKVVDVELEDLEAIRDRLTEIIESRKEG